jgi:predicted nucleic acid-binding protein
VIPNIGVFDAGPLIAFHQVDRLELLRHLFARKIVPPEVAREVEPSLGELPVWMEVKSFRSILTFPRNLGVGERAAIALATEFSADFVVLDDRRARSAAREHRLMPIGSLGLLVSAKRFGLVTEVRPLMDAMISHGLYASDGLYRQILSLASEYE